MKSKILISILCFVSLSAQDTSLSQAYQMALNNDHGLKQNIYEGFATKERTKQTLASFFPSVSFDVSYNGQRYKKNSIKVDESYIRYGVSINQIIFRPASWYELNQDKLREQGSDLINLAVEQDLAKKVAKAYFDYSHALNSLEFAKQYEEVTKARFKQLQKSLEFGLSNKMDLLESKVRLDEARLNINKVKQQIQIANLELTSIIGSQIEVNKRLSNLDLEFFKGIMLEQFSDISKNLQYKQSEILTQISNEELKKRKSEHLPSVNLNVGYYNDRYMERKYPIDENNKLQSTISFVFPIFTGGQTAARVEEARLLNLSNIERQKNSQNKILVEQKKVVSEFLNLIDEVDLTRLSLENSLLYRDFVQQAYNDGLKDVVDLFDAQAKVFRMQNELLNSSHKLVLSYLELEALIGNISILTMENLERAF
ncbi:TolC family protein [Campylobacter sp.]|uniref:TolC family protein n=1 Tax=Campylobacter sp. TaxID=205 RepID=UPI0027022B83|nr:TolC family protein [Campylobacter sp.]